MELRCVLDWLTNEVDFEWNGRKQMDILKGEFSALDIEISLWRVEEEWRRLTARTLNKEVLPAF